MRSKYIKYATPPLIGIGSYLGYLGYLKYFGTGRIVQNNYNKSIWAKHELNTYPDPIEVKPFTALNNIDGLATPFKPDHVFKIPNGFDVVIKSNGDIIFTSIESVLYGFWEKYKGYQPINGEWHNLLKLKQDKGWEKLYDKSKFSFFDI